jgi:hypothetical protein
MPKTFSNDDRQFLLALRAAGNLDNITMTRIEAALLNEVDRIDRAIPGKRRYVSEYEPEKTTSRPRKAASRSRR